MDLAIALYPSATIILRPMMKLPLGIQHFTTIREEGYAYVDKTRQIYEMVSTGKFYFLSRPRRFGKSLTVSTLNELYTGNRKLFEGLWIEDKWDWERRLPVIWLEFAASGYRSLGLPLAISKLLDRVAMAYGVDLSEEDIGLRLQELIERLHAMLGPVVVLVDEYDKPLIDYTDDRDTMEEHRLILRSFFSVLKNAGDKIELLLITGVSAFSKVNLFSDLNNLTNLTLDPLASTLTGVTPEELEITFAEQLRNIDRERLRRWYNGYTWDGVNKLYNPWSLLNFLRTGRFSNFWFNSGTPSFLFKLIKDHGVFRLSNLKTTETELLKFDLVKFQLAPLLFQTGYLTLASPPEHGGFVQLTYPNEEVKQALDLFLLQEYAGYDEAMPHAYAIRQATLDLDFDGLIKEFNALLASVPYDHFSGQNEHFFHAIFYLVLRTVGISAKSEVHTAKGRCDLLIELNQAIVVLEFKLDQLATVAIEQITERGYLSPYVTDERRKIAGGFRVDSGEKRITEWEIVEV